MSLAFCFGMALLDHAERALITPLLTALDGCRAWLLKHSAPVSRVFVRSRGWRVFALALLVCAAALFATVFGVGYSLLLGPVIFGVPHLFSEARYLFFQRRSARRWVLVCILVAQAVSVFAGFGIYSLGLASAAALWATAPARSWRGVALLSLAALAQAASVIGPTWSRFLLLHLHNCVPLLVWAFWRKRPAFVSFAVPLIACLAAAAILGGYFDAIPLRTPLRDDIFSLTKITDAVAGGFGGEWRRRLLLFFCFTQAVHYAVWLRLIPEEARARETPRSWKASWEAYKRDSGANIARLTLLATAAMPVFAFAVGVVRARSLYVTLSEFHATVEVILLVVYASAPDTTGSASPDERLDHAPDVRQDLCG
jgi:hypothetical protein